MTFNTLFADVPVSGTTHEHWKKQSPAMLEAAAKAIEKHGANPWVFTADARHFEQFATRHEWLALFEMDAEAQDALMHDMKSLRDA